jgi:hypothetical protein
MISKMPRIVGKMVIGRQITPMMVLSAVAEATNPQKRLIMPLVRVITAMAVTRPGFCREYDVFIRYSLFFV